MSAAKSARPLSGKAHDPMLELVAQLPDQLEAGLRLTQGLALSGLARLERVTVCGMGGSAAAADLLRGALGASAAPIDVSRSYQLPGGITDRSLLVFSSYSGNTEETLAAYDECEAARVGAQRIVLCSGGALADRARRDSVATLMLPAGLPPRASLGLGLGALIGLLRRVAGRRDQLADQVAEAAALLRASNAEYGADAPVAENPARQLARRLYGKLPLLYAASGLAEAAAWRWKTQINENAKALAYVGVLPELDHNEIVGWDAATQWRGELFVVALRDRYDHVRLQRRFGLTRELLEGRAGGWETFESRGESPLARVLSLVQLGDYLSVYLAGEYGAPATPVDAIERLKERLAEPA